MKTLLEIQKVVEDVYGYLILSNNSITPNQLKQEIDLKIGRKEEENTLIKITEYIRKVVLEDKKREKSSLDQYKTLLNSIIEFELNNHLTITAEKLDAELFNAFIDHCRAKTKKINSVWKYYKCFKTVLKEISRKYKVNVFNPTDNLSTGDKIQQVSENKIYLNFEQIGKILEFKLENERLSNVRFILTILVFTGCRYSDVFKIIPEHYYDKRDIQFNYAHFLTEKTDTEIKVPILRPLLLFFEQNDNTPLIRFQNKSLINT